ncbi:tRNA-dihydrouridine synthase family protein, partial [Candidatus Peregrinibacteria bacterium]|nr:tRNA-dihydrouridine synthase family protein [Candidatus Peregrinibacteria bacterium]
MGKRGFWDKLKKPIVGLAPMDGVTDFAFRHMLAKYGKPSIIFTEFVNVEGLARGAVKMLSAFIYEEKERPIVGQLFGVEVDSFYKSALMLCALGFDGIDINMGCPVNKIAKRGSGAGLIKTPEIAKKIILTVKKAAEDFANGAELKDVGVSDEMIKKIEEMNFGKGEFVRKIIPISVKTRIGYDKIVAEEWVKHLLEVKPANITMHGRTL